MDETVISWNLPNIISIIFMLLIIWMVFGFVGHFVFRQGGSTNSTQSVQTSSPFSGNPAVSSLGM